MMSTAANSVSEAYLIPYPAESFSKPVPIQTGQTTIGRDVANSIQILQGSVSPRHATIAVQDGQYVLTDLESLNGTFLNEQKIRSAVLKHHDKISFGDRTFLFLMKADPARSGPLTALFSQNDAVAITEDSVEPSELLAQTAASAALGMFPPSLGLPAVEAGEAALAHQRLSLLYQLSEKLRSTRVTEEILQKGLELILTAIPAAARGVVMLGGQADGTLKISAVKMRDPQAAERSIPISRTIVDWVLSERMVLVSQNLSEDSRFQDSESIRIHNLNAILVVPLLKGEKVMGMLYVDGHNILEAFTQQDVAFAAAVANELALCIENIELQQELIQNERMAAIGLMMTNLAHNIKNLLTLNQNALDLLGLQLRDLEDPRIQKSWRYITQSFTRINNLAVNMLAYAREQEMAPRPTLINQLILSHREAFEQSLVNKGIALEMQLSPDNPRWLMDGSQFQRAFINLVVNAIDAVKEQPNGRIVVSTRINEQGWLEVSVADNGTGIPPEHHARIFDLFYSTKGTGGSGLGLSMVKKFTDKMGGTIHLTSEVGKGSTFTLAFPEKPPGI